MIVWPTTPMVDKILQTLYGFWVYDMEVFSNVWMYAPLCLPAVVYLGLFFLKWSVVTAPVWLPIALIFRAAKSQ